MEKLLYSMATNSLFLSREFYLALNINISWSSLTRTKIESFNPFLFVSKNLLLRRKRRKKERENKTKWRGERACLYFEPPPRLFFHDLFPALCLHVRQTGRFVWLKAVIVNDSPRPSVSKGFRAKKIFDYRRQFSRCLAAAIATRDAVLKLFEVCLLACDSQRPRSIWKHLEIEASSCYFLLLCNTFVCRNANVVNR